MSVSPNHLSTLFKSKIGVGFSEYLTEVRIRQAKRLLITSDLRSVRSENGGVSEYGVFQHAVQEKHRADASQYRRSHTL